jgi:UDP-N-acetylglucosamine 1-carboxyvinyltransferase
VRHEARVPPIQYIVEGGHRLTGTIEPSGNKNAALPIIAAALLPARANKA